MPSNRLTPHQFAPGNTADGTRIEAAVRALCEKFEDFPAEFVARRWSMSPLVWGFTPPIYDAGVPEYDAVHSLPFLPVGPLVMAGLETPADADIENEYRNKSLANITVDRYAMEVTLLASRPLIIGSLTVLAEAVAGGSYTNNWVAATEGVFSLQVCVSDAWDLENRKKLRQEALIYETAPSRWGFDPSGLGPGADPVSPVSPWAPFDGKGVTAQPMILVPAGGRVVFQWIIPVNNGSWGDYPWQTNVWNLCAQVWSPMRRGGDR